MCKRLRFYKPDILWKNSKCQYIARNTNNKIANQVQDEVTFQQF